MNLSDVPALKLEGVDLTVGGQRVLRSLSWTVLPGQRWVVLGPNGCGKTSLLRVASLYLHPSKGTVWVLGEQLGRCDVRRLRTKVGLASQALADMLRAELTATEAVMTAKYAALEPWWHSYDVADRERAVVLLDRLGVGAFAERRVGALSSGERQRVQLARTLMGDPELLLLDEPTAGLDLAGREDLIDRLSRLSSEAPTQAAVLVTHHVEEIPQGFDQVLLLRGGAVVAQGPIADNLTSESLSDCLGMAVDLKIDRGRYRAWPTD